MPGPPGYGLGDLISYANSYAEPAVKSLGRNEVIPNSGTKSIKENVAPIDVVLLNEELATIRKSVDSAIVEATSNATSRSWNIAKLLGILRWSKGILWQIHSHYRNKEIVIFSLDVQFASDNLKNFRSCLLDSEISELVVRYYGLGTSDRENGVTCIVTDPIPFPSNLLPFVRRTQPLSPYLDSNPSSVGGRIALNHTNLQGKCSLLQCSGFRQSASSLHWV